MLAIEIIEIVNKGTLLGTVGDGRGGLQTVLLKDDKVTADLRTGLVDKEVVGKTDDTEKMGTLHHGIADRLVTGGIHDTLRGDEGDDTAIPDLVDGLQEEIVMDGLGGKAVGIILTLTVRGIEDGDITKGDITGGNVKGAGITPFDGLIAVHMHVILRIEAL